MRIFAGVEEEYGKYETAKAVLIPVPYDGTSTWIKGADKGPDAFLDAADNMEIYDIETKSEPYKNGIFLDEPVTEDASPEAMTDAVHARVKKYLDDDKFVTLFGGEHSISIGSIRAFGEKYGKITVLQLDAHTDLRPEYHGSKCNHACAVFEANEKHHLVQVGIRSMDTSEVQYLKEENVFFAHQIAENPNWIEDVFNRLGDNPVYITIDLDGFDPSICPSTGTPEPGGLPWYPTLKLLKKVIQQKNVVGFDIVELAPNENEKSSDFLAAKLYYKMLAYQFTK
ncbi:agmatinase [Ornithobacterium rhinotracheale]|uniref:Agmatinase n=1 Tax=Ornithobacterium rhinotracheale (strain ATCC 51463 / DSM 15997 / CCUG 23171 / CIP 104009 / LMG 9086) TaxID=867902 RepID=I3ZX35_ORNRL|nr:agmatinase [Ornithobacterium rhinotracheale]AFL96269.1 agmatinase [Ornithobacterium rhinotracheale DSM 15997]AIP98504.1 agmatinase [Ornithobacterium rhinotracheale ORT-UMN 88]KGB67912.1 agmatinase [Ornithobacterium rhinotracheale H06-030791]MBN3663130.1 agmatinase [Ornithobacterium rhinotracheale]MCK0193121.1 agmatinase [Ornithobacterium rhinotracheale]